MNTLVFSLIWHPTPRSSENMLLKLRHLENEPVFKSLTYRHILYWDGLAFLLSNSGQGLQIRIPTFGIALIYVFSMRYGSKGN